MTDETAGLLIPEPDRAVGSPSRWRRWHLPRIGLRGVAIAGLFAAVLIGVYMYQYEGGWANQRFVIAATLLTAALAVFATRRPLVAAVLVPALAGIVVQAGAVKHKLLQMNLHAYDVVFYLTSGPTLTFLWTEYSTYMAQLLAAFAALALATAVAYRMDGTRVTRLYAGLAVAVCIGLTALAAAFKGERSHTQQYWDDLTLSTFFSSMSDAAETLWRGQFIEAAPDGNSQAAAFTVPTACSPDQKPPHIILIHQESVVPPGIVPGVIYDKSVDTLFTSFDRKVHPLRVETYGGASWLTEFSILTGVSTYSFGSMRTFVHSAMGGKIRDTLPQALARCGYRNLAFFPGDKNFVSYAKFYSAVGIPEILDIRDMRGKRNNERDKFFYDQTMDTMARHFKASHVPLFTYVLTMATHGPYDRTYMPEINLPSGHPSNKPEMNEYLRRLSMARMDYDYFVAELKKRFPKEQFLIVHYGDHHPTATKSYLGYGDVEHPQDVPLQKDSIGFITYYAMQGLNYTPPAMPDVETLDVPYLGTALLDAAGLPLSDANRERKRLMNVCGGRYYGCQDRSQILAFHRRLIDSGLIEAR